MTESEQELHDVRAFNSGPQREAEIFGEVESGVKSSELSFDIPRD